MCLSKKTESLNQSGAFLQIHIMNELKNHKWGLVSEHPVRISPFLDHPEYEELIGKNTTGEPIRSYDFIKVMNDSRDKTIVKETSVDIFAAKLPDSRIMTQKINKQAYQLFIESKKLNPKYIDWVFFKIKPWSEDSIRILTKKRNRCLETTLFKTPITTKSQHETYLGIDSIEKDVFNYQTCDFGLYYPEMISPSH